MSQRRRRCSSSRRLLDNRERALPRSAVGGGFMPAPHDLAREVGMLLDRGSNHERGRLDAVLVEQVKQPWDAFDGPVFEPGVGRQVEVALRHGAIQRIGAKQVLPAGLEHQRGGDRNPCAIRPECGCCTRRTGLGRGWGRCRLGGRRLRRPCGRARNAERREYIASRTHGSFLSFRGLHWLKISTSARRDHGDARWRRFKRHDPGEPSVPRSSAMVRRPGGSPPAGRTRGHSEARFGHTGPWSRGTMPMPLYRKRCTRLPSKVSVV